MKRHFQLRRFFFSFVLASTQELHEKIAELAIRVRELEDALRSSHSRLSVEQHPLLTEELLKIKAPLQRELPSNRDLNAVTVKTEEVDPEVVDAFGSLQISVSGKSKYFGQIANSWVFLFLIRTAIDRSQLNSQYFLQVSSHLGVLYDLIISVVERVIGRWGARRCSRRSIQRPFSRNSYSSICIPNFFHVSQRRRQRTVAVLASPPC